MELTYLDQVDRLLAIGEIFDEVETRGLKWSPISTSLVAQVCLHLTDLQVDHPALSRSDNLVVEALTLPVQLDTIKELVKELREMRNALLQVKQGLERPNREIPISFCKEVTALLNSYNHSVSQSIGRLLCRTATQAINLSLLRDLDQEGVQPLLVSGSGFIAAESKRIADRRGWTVWVREVRTLSLFERVAIGFNQLANSDPWFYVPHYASSLGPARLYRY